jgi:hypothetical protein
VHAQELLVEQHVERCLIERRKITSEEERRSQESPQREMCPLLVTREPSVAFRLVPSPADSPEDEHIRIVPAARSGEVGEVDLTEPDAIHRLPGILDVTGRAPGVRADV